MVYTMETIYTMEVEFGHHGVNGSQMAEFGHSAISPRPFYTSGNSLGWPWILVTFVFTRELNKDRALRLYPEVGIPDRYNPDLLLSRIRDPDSLFRGLLTLPT